MNINRKTWHYKWWRICGGDRYRSETVSLCGYVQRLFWISLMYATLAGLVLYAAGGMIYILVMSFVHNPGLTSIFTFGVLAGSALLFFILYKWHTSTPKPPGLIRSWIKARKSKVCPLLTFTDGADQ